MNKDNVVVFSTDEGYILPTAVAIYSILSNKKHDTHINFYIMTEKVLSEESNNILVNCLSIDRQSTLTYLYVGDKFKSNKMTIGHISKATYYRLLLPQLLKDVDQCLYLDGDICAYGDISRLLDIKMYEEEYIAGVKSANIQLRRRGKGDRLDILGIDNLDTYINAGVLVLNLKSIRQNNIDKEMLKLALNNYPLQDQDVINISCFNHIKILHPKYNAMPSLFRYNKGRLSNIYTVEEIDECRKRPVIVHYAERYKPWKFSGIDKSENWYVYYKDIFHEEKLKLSNVYPIRIKDYIEEKIKIVAKVINKRF